MRFAWFSTPIVIYVEANLGYESEHHERAMRGLANVYFHRDVKRGRVGVCTTHAIKHACSTLCNTLLREDRICLMPDNIFVSNDTKGNKLKLREQMYIYSYQYKTANSIFGRDKMALSGKVGGMKDDMCLSLQMCIYHSSF
jgi:hypothetical protein